MPDIYKCTVSLNIKLTDSIFQLSLINKILAKQILPGQFLHIKCANELILRRPISAADIIDDEIYLVIEIKGVGTQWLSQTITGDTLDVLGPLGNGFTLSGENVILVGGGLGIPPLLYAAKNIKGKKIAILGFRNKENSILTDNFKQLCDEVYITTDDGSYGIHGDVLKPLKELLNNKYDCVLTCGPKSMMACIAAECRKYDVPVQASLEERMGCGVGACYVCVCKTKSNDIPSMSRVCIDGPVFDAEKVVW